MVKKKIKKIDLEKIKDIEKTEKSSESPRPKTIWATGKRKTAVAVIKLEPNGQGKVVINKKFTLENYFPWFIQRQITLAPLTVVDKKNDFDINIRVKGGGKMAQAEAIRLGLTKSLSFFNQEWRDDFKKLGFLTRDSRKKERKKPGLKRARRAPQWQKR